MNAPRAFLTLVLGACLAPGCHRDAGEADASASADSEHAGQDEKGKEAGKKHDEVKLSKEALEENQIKVEPATKRVLVPRLAAAARVAFNAEATARVGAPVAGRVVEVKTHLGDAVKQGAELLIVESTDLGEAQGDYLQKRAAVGAAEAAAEAAKVSFQRGKELQERSEGVARGEVEKREADLRAAQATARSAAAAMAAARTRLKLLGMPDDAVAKLEQGGDVQPRYAVRAPIEGTVVRLDATTGALVAPDKETLLDLADLRTVWVLADVPESRAPAVRAGAAAHVSTSAAGEPLEGKVSYVAPFVDPATRSVQVRVVVPNDKGLLRPGTFARAEIDESTDKPPEPVLAVADEAVQTIEGERVVFVPVEGEEGTFARREVKVGEAVGGEVPVQSGLKEGEQVVTHGAFVLKAELSKPAEEE
jgi:cobalt-zinc-cadmium efflux system membrane fusion protein